MTQVKVANLTICNVGFVVMLKSLSDERTLPIFIGVPEAQAIALQMNKVQPPRPMTHDLMKAVLDAVEGRLERIEVADLRDGTYYGKLVVAFEGHTIDVDARPSDAIALALRCHSPIYVADHVMQEAAAVLDEAKATSSRPQGDASGPDVRSGEDDLRDALQRAIREERYEDAARIRDRMKNRSN
jgi:bifunctional DNase/RNase